MRIVSLAPVTLLAVVLAAPAEAAPATSKAKRPAKAPNKPVRMAQRPPVEDEAPTPAETRRTVAQDRQRQAAAPDRQAQDAARARRRAAADTGDPDVLLDVPNLSVEEVTLEVDNLKGKLNLDARLANLLVLSAGADIGIDRVNLTIKGVKAEALLKVRLDNVAQILERTLETIDKNPQILERVLQSVDNAVGTVGNVANTALQPGGLLSQTVNTLGQTVTRVLDRTGNIVERTLDKTGNVVGEKTIGNLLSLNLPVVNETKNTAGQTVRRVRDTTGAVLELTLDQAGKLLRSRVVSPAPAPENKGEDQPAAPKPEGSQ